MKGRIPCLAVVVPCYNEAAVLPKTAPAFAAMVSGLVRKGKVSDKSFILFVNDGSSDETWSKIMNLHENDGLFKGISLSRNRGHQNALLAGLMETRSCSDIVISADCDGQDDLQAIEAMVDEWAKGAEVVYACRNSRESDTWFKKTTAETFYRLIRWLGGEVVFNHADYRLATARVLDSLSQFGEVNLFLRGLFPLLGYKSAKVFYSRKERIAGESHYPFLKMLGFAVDGVTSLSIKPIRFITLFGAAVSLFSFFMAIWTLVSWLRGVTVPGWTSEVLCVCFLCGIQLISLGVIGEYVGKIYLECKHRPRYIVSERT